MNASDETGNNQNASAYEYLQFGDALFLFLERPVTPLNIAAISVLEGKVTREELVEYLEERLHLLPRFTQKVVMSPMNLALPHWEPDPAFDLSSHVREVHLRRGTEAEFKQKVAEILSPMMDRSRPLWDFTVLHGLAKKNTGLVIRAHHAMVDGVAGIHLLNTLMDTTKRVRRSRGRRKEEKVVERPDALSMLASDLIYSCFGALGRALTIQRDIAAFAQENLAASRSETPSHATNGRRTPQMDHLGALAAELGAPARRFPFNRVCQGPQKFTWAEIPFDRIHRVKKHLGMKVNDVMLTAVSSAYRDFAEKGGARADYPLRVVIPVNTRRDAQGPDLGNQITFAPIDVPLGVKKLPDLLKEVHRRTQVMKSVGLAEFVALGGLVLGLVPPPLQAAVAGLICQLPISLCNVIFTNVPGPQQKLYLNGHRVLKCYPYVPIGGEMAINCAVLTYNGTAYFGFSGDAQVSEDLDKIAQSLVRNFEELEKSLGLAKRKPRIARKQKPRTPAQDIGGLKVERETTSEPFEQPEAFAVASA